MRGRPLIYALPVGQMGLAIALLWSSQRWLESALRVWDSPGTAPQYVLVLSINMPVALVRMVWRNHVPDLWDDVLFVAAIGTFWYWVSLNILFFRERKRLVLFESVPLTIAANMLLISVSAVIGWFCVSEMIGFPTPLVAQFPWAWRIPIYALLMSWSLGGIFLSIRDLIHCRSAVRSENPQAPKW